MVFETIVIDVLNRFLGEYVENLDSSQLKIGIWGGDVVLTELKLKETALDDLNLPIKVTWGQLGKLVLKIPWTNLYSAPVIVNIEDLFVLISPQNEVIYVPEKEEKWAQEAKQAELRRIEEAKKRALEKDATKSDDSFVEKLATQIIKNVHVEMNNIHIRYEDRTTHPGAPFSVGATLSSLTLQTTDKDLNPCFAADNVTFIYKVLKLDGLSIYWNPSSEIKSSLCHEDRVEFLRSNIPTGGYSPPGYSYVFGPISCSARLVLNPKPETDGTNFTTPKIELTIDMDQFSVALTRRQFQDMMLLAENMDRLAKGIPYRKFRPNLKTYKENYKAWWHFAYNCIIVDIQRRRRDWDWKHILTHRTMCRDYQKCYARTLGPKPPKDAVIRVRELEVGLDLLNLVLLRERASVEIKRVQQAEENTSKGWFSGWFGGSSQPVTEGEQFKADLASRIENAMTPDEKQKLYQAIDYQENAAPTHYPATFVGTRLKFRLAVTRVRVYDDSASQRPLVLDAALHNLSMKVEQRPSASALNVRIAFGELSVVGIEQPTGVPHLVQSVCSGNEDLINVLFETNPLDGGCDQRIHVSSRPLTIIYNQETIAKLQDIFTMVDTARINQIKAKTTASLPTFKQMSSMGLQFAIEKRTRLDVKISLSSSTILIPYEGVYLSERSMLVMKLGQLTVETEEQRTTADISVKQLFLQGSTEEEIFSSIVSESYTKFVCNLTGVQILMRLEKEDWESALENAKSTPLHLLQPTNLQVVMKKSLVTEDARIPKMIIEGVLPIIHINISEERLLALAGLVFSIPQPEKPPQESQSRSSSTWSLASLSTHLEHKTREIPKMAASSNDVVEQIIQGTDLMCQFQLNELLIEVRKPDSTGVARKFVSLAVRNLRVELVQKTFETIIGVQLAAVDVNQIYADEDLHVVATGSSQGHDYLFSLNLLSCEKTAPDFYTAKGAVLNRINMHISQSSVLLNQRAMLALMEFVNNILTKIDEVKKTRETVSLSITTAIEIANRRKLSLILEEGQRPKPVVRARRQASKRVEVIDLKVDVALEQIAVAIHGRRPIAKVAVEGIKIAMSSRQSYSTYDVRLRSLSISDLNPNTMYSTIVMSPAKETIHLNLTTYNKEFMTKTDAVEMSVEGELEQIRLVYLFGFISQLLEFSNSFQSAKDAVKEASSAAAERAKQNVIKAYEDASKLSLKFHIKAPLIVVPLNSKSNEALVADLGVLTVNNSFTTVEQTDEGTPVMDMIRLDLQDLMITRATVNQQSLEVSFGYPILEPVTFELLVKRNLSASWYKKIPDLEVFSKLRTVKVSLDQEDYAFALAVMCENHAEGVQMETGLQGQGTEDSDREASAEDSVSVHTAILFTFSMESFIISLYPGGVKKVSEKEHLRPRKECGLALFVLEMLVLKGKMFSNGSLCTSIRLVNCRLQDTRKGEGNGLSTLLARKQEDGSNTVEAKSMIDITYEQNPSSKFANLRVCSFALILSMDYLMKLAAFFTVDSAGSPPPTNTSSSRKTRSVAAPQAAPAISTQEPSIDTAMTFEVHIEKPDIMIVENMDDINTNALVFHTEISMKYRISGPKRVLSATVIGLELYSCCFNPEKRKQTLQQVVKPVTLSIAGSDPESKGLHIDLHCTPIDIAVCPNTIQLLSQCYATLSSQQDPLENLKEETDWSGMWNVKQFEEKDYWFLSGDEAVEAEETYSFIPAPGKPSDEICLISVPSIVITVEAGVGKRTIPMILLEMGLEGDARSWSSGLTIDATVRLGMQYYNTSLSAWEPMIEPIDKSRNKTVLFQPWQINCQVAMSKIDDEDGLIDEYTPRMSINLMSEENLEITFTKSCLEVLNHLGESFANAVNGSIANVRVLDPPTYVIKNDTGLVARIMLKASELKSLNKDVNDMDLKSGEKVELTVSNSSRQPVSRFVSYESPTSSNAENKSFLTLTLPGVMAEPLSIPLSRAVKRFYPNSASGTGIVAEISTNQSTTTVVLRSIIQVVNHFSVPINVHYMNHRAKQNEAELLGTVDPHGFFNIPIHGVYSNTNKLFFSVEGYSVTELPFDWKSLQKELNFSLLTRCPSKNNEDQDPFFLQIVGEVDQIYFASTYRRTMASMCYNIHLQPTVELLNSLPTDITLAAQGSIQEQYIKSGNKIPIIHCEPGFSTITLRISDYLEKEWSCRRDIPANPSEYFVLCFESFDSVSPVSLNLGVHCSIVRGTISLTLYCPFWMINKTGYQLSYKFDDGSPVIYHPASYIDPIMFSPSPKRFGSKKKGSVKIGQGEWSEKFSLDVAGSAGLIACKGANGCPYTLSISIVLTYSSLTKMIIFTPAYVVVNKTMVTLEFQEIQDGKEEWQTVEKDSCTSLWPMLGQNSKLHVRVAGTNQSTPSFNYHSTYSCLLKLPNKYGGIFLDVQNTAAGIYINLSPYQPGLAEAIILNYCPVPVTIWEKGNEAKKLTLASRCSSLFTWDRPTGPRVLVWSQDSKVEYAATLQEDVCGEMKATRGCNSLWFASFLDGMQRVLLITDVARIAEATQASSYERNEQEITFQLHGIGISVVNNFTQAELLYIGLVSSGIIWEARKEKGRRYKSLGDRESSIIERAYQKYTDSEKSGSSFDPIFVFDNKIQVNLETLEILAPNRRRLRRSFAPGMWCSLQKSTHSSRFHAKINRLQIDNQSIGCFFPVILAPVPPPKTVAAGQEPKPFIEVSVFNRITAHSAITQYKYFKVLVQEFHVKLDVGFVNEILAFFVSEETSDVISRQRFLRDIEQSRKPLLSHISVISSLEQKHFYDHLHFSPLKIHLSFSLAGNVGSRAIPPALSMILQSLGVTLTDINDAVFRLSYFERKNAFLTRSQLQSETVSHYTGQALRQIYVIVFGLDVIGNPFGLITGIGEGVEALFYEPFQGIIQGPGEFAEGLGLGVKSLFGHTVGGAAGAFSKITGSLGKGLAVLSMDKEYQQQRIEQQNRRPDNIQSTVAQGGKGLVMGVVHGVTGVVTKPISGAKEEGVGGFFKGVGKGVLGLVTRPATGVVDFASTSLHAVKRATDQGDEASRLRPPRFLRERLVVPYRSYDAEGNMLLKEIDNRRYATTDTYHFHMRLPDGNVVILSDKRLIIITMSDVFATWQVNLTFTWTELATPPADHPKGIAITLARKKSPALFGMGSDSKVIQVFDTEDRRALLEKMLEVYMQEVTKTKM